MALVFYWFKDQGYGGGHSNGFGNGKIGTGHVVEIDERAIGNVKRRNRQVDRWPVISCMSIRAMGVARHAV